MPLQRLFITTLLTTMLVAGCTVEPKPEPPASPPPQPPGTGSIQPDPAMPLVVRQRSSLPVPLLLEQARKNLEQGELKAAASDAEVALRDQPNDREALQFMAEAAQRYAQSLTRPESSKWYLMSANAARALRASYPDLSADDRRYFPAALYNEACTYAVNGESDLALKSLKEAFDAGFNAVDQLDEDPELDSLRKLPAFQQLQRDIERLSIDRLLAQTKGPMFPFDFHLKSVDGKEVSLGDFKGKVVLVDFWGTWCLPCRKDIPHLVELDKRYRDKGLAVVGINHENEPADAAAKTIRAFMKDQGIAYTCVVGDDATQKQVPEFEGYPTMLLIDREGKVRIKASGYQPLSTLEAAVLALLGDVKAPPGDEAAGK